MVTNIKGATREETRRRGMTTISSICDSRPREREINSTTTSDILRDDYSSAKTRFQVYVLFSICFVVLLHLLWATTEDGFVVSPPSELSYTKKGNKETFSSKIEVFSEEEQNDGANLQRVAPVYGVVGEKDDGRREGTTASPVRADGVVHEVNEKTATALSSPKGGELQEDPTFLTSKMRTVPNLLLLGTQKAGTTTLANWMTNDLGGICEAKIFPGEPEHWKKEVHFFDYTPRYRQNITFYEQRFQHCFDKNRTNKYKYAMDATPETMLHPRRIREIYDQIDDPYQRKSLKLIFILREPTSRDLSMYNHMVSMVLNHDRTYPNRNLTEFWYGSVAKDPAGQSFYSFAEFMTNYMYTNNKQNHKWDHGWYGYHIEQITRYNSRSQLLVLGYDELKSNPDKVQWRIQEFLGMRLPTNNSTESQNSGNFKQSNSQSGAHKLSKMDCDTQKLLLEYYRPSDQKLYKFLEANPGPSMEQRPFPTFLVANCTKTSS